MIGVIRKQLIFTSLILIFGFFFTSKVNAASLASVSDTITTSRPSASAPLNADQAASATQISVVDNGSIYLASDSAVLQADTGQTLELVNVASMSAQITGTPNTRNVYFTSAITNTHHKGTAVLVPVTATHTIKFTTVSNVPNGGKIVITFPGSGVNTASPSASTFSFNGMTASGPTDVLCFPTTACSGAAITVSAPTITLTTGAAQSGATTIYVLIGCTAQSSGVCTTFAPRLINPTKTAAAGTADTWKITVKTQDASLIDLDTAKAVIATVDAVQVQGTVDAYITFSIAGRNNGTSACSDTTNPGAGLDATATFVNLGALVSSAINISAQRLTVDTNGSGGYSITATSSGRFINPASGFWIANANGGNGLTANDATNGTAPAPGFFTVGTPAFGIHPCLVAGSYAPTIPAGWSTGATGGGAGAKYSNPWNTGTNGFYASIASYSGPAAASQTDVEYAATVGATTPAGIYSNYFTYVATPIF